MIESGQTCKDCKHDIGYHEHAIDTPQYCTYINCDCKNFKLDLPE